MWNETFDTPDYVFGTEPAAFLRVHAGFLKPGLKGLALADGEGRNSVFMAGQGVETLAMDSAPNALAKARALAEARGVRVAHVEASITEWDWQPAAFDLVVAVFIQFLAPAERAAVFAGMVRTLRPGGVLMLHGYRPEQLAYGTGGPRAENQLYTEALLRESFAALDILVLDSYDRDLAEGARHRGPSALIDLIARKPA
ncbi:MAG: SAM-dependent methyltransferase [Rhodobacterales bacterium]|nr:MAG: SAM-dependent methyltransferase [Rhodobacterales bacterium]